MSCPFCRIKIGELCELEGENVCTYCGHTEPNSIDLTVYVGREENDHAFRHVHSRRCVECKEPLTTVLIPCGGNAINVTAEFKQLERIEK